MSKSNDFSTLTTLTDREQDVLRLLATGCSDREIADTLVLSVGTVKWYNRQIYNKLGVRNRVEAVTQAQEQTLLVKSTAQPSLIDAKKKENHLPAQLTSFIGRKQEIHALKKLLQEFRLVTLTGPPGTGKTRLALEVAATMADVYRDGVFFISLAPVQDPNLVPNAIAQNLKVTEVGADSPLMALLDYLRERHLLIVMDNYEHLLSAAPLASTLLKTAPNLTIMATSREALRLYGEYDFSVPPLQLPDLKQDINAESAQFYEAVDLLIQRAKAVNSSFALDDSNAAVIAMICVHLDGLPLSIELAAAHMRFSAPQTLLLKLGSRLETLSEGPRDLPDRQRTLRATLAWSYELLDKDEQILFARLGIFAGGCTREAIKSVCGIGLGVSIDTGLDALVMKNLLQQEHVFNGERRFTMLETMREFAVEKLTEQKELLIIREQHARYFMEKAREAAQAVHTSDEEEWLDWLEMGHDNLRAAMEWSLAVDATGQTSFELIANLAPFWHIRGYFSEARAWLSRVLKLPDLDARTKAQADAFFGISFLTHLQGAHIVAKELCEEALAIYQQLGDKRSSSLALVRLSEVTTGTGDYEAAAKLSKQAYAIALESGDIDAQVNAICQMGFDNMRLGHYDYTCELLNDALTLLQTSDDKLGKALVYAGLGELAIRTGELGNAISLLRQSLQLRESLGDRWGIAAVLGNFGWVALIQQDFEKSADILIQSLLIRLEIGEKGGLSWCLEKLAEISALDQDTYRAVRIFGAASAIRKSVDSTIDPCDQEHYEQIIGLLRQELGDDVFEVVWSEGQEMNIEQIIQYICE